MREHLRLADDPDLILEATRAIHRGRGVLYVYGNYAGDNMNFDIAAEMAADEGIEVRTVRVMDDVAAMPVEQNAGAAGNRRGVLPGSRSLGRFVGASDLAEAEAVVRAAQGEIRSIGVALSAGVAAAERGADVRAARGARSKSGWGCMGSRGSSGGGMMAADPMVDLMLGKVLPEPAVRAGGAGGAAAQRAGVDDGDGADDRQSAGQAAAGRGGDRRWRRHSWGRSSRARRWRGFSISLMRLDPERERLLGKPGWSLGYRF